MKEISNASPAVTSDAGGFTPKLVIGDEIIKDSDKLLGPRPKSTLTRPNLPARAQAKVETELSTSKSARGKASWYCKAGVSPCHYKYPPGSMVAAACAKLRAAMGPDWRGKTVKVERSRRVYVHVKLVDWCGSKDKLIDLYWAPMSQLGGTGVLRVTVSW